MIFPPSKTGALKTLKGSLIHFFVRRDLSGIHSCDRPFSGLKLAVVVSYTFEEADPFHIKSDSQDHDMHFFSRGFQQRPSFKLRTLLGKIRGHTHTHDKFKTVAFLSERKSLDI